MSKSPNLKCTLSRLKSTQNVFYLRDALLARISYGPVFVCLSVCSSVRHKLVCTETAERIELIFGTEATLGLSSFVLEENSGISKNKGTYLCPKLWT